MTLQAAESGRKNTRQAFLSAWRVFLRFLSLRPSNRCFHGADIIGHRLRRVVAVGLDELDDGAAYNDPVRDAGDGLGLLRGCLLYTSRCV